MSHVGKDLCAGSRKRNGEAGFLRWFLEGRVANALAGGLMREAGWGHWAHTWPNLQDRVAVWLIFIVLSVPCFPGNGTQLFEKEIFQLLHVDS